MSTKCTWHGGVPEPCPHCERTKAEAREDAKRHGCVLQEDHDEALLQIEAVSKLLDRVRRRVSSDNFCDCHARIGEPHKTDCLVIAVYAMEDCTCKFNGAHLDGCHGKKIEALGAGLTDKSQDEANKLKAEIERWCERSRIAENKVWEQERLIEDLKKGNARLKADVDLYHKGTNWGDEGQAAEKRNGACPICWGPYGACKCERTLVEHKLIKGGCECKCPHVPGLDKLAHDTLLQVEELKKENAALQEKKVGIPRLLEAMASSPGAEERKALVDRIKELEEQVEELKTDLKESNAHADALIFLSHGLHDRIEGKPDWVVGSNCQTALNFIDFLTAKVQELKGDIQKVIAADSSEIAAAKSLIEEIRSMEVGHHKVGDIYDHMKKIANQKAGNPWAPNQDYPGKPV